MFTLTGWRYYWSRYLGWFPIQFCHVCGSWYWGGFPKWAWVKDHYTVNHWRWEWRQVWSPSWGDYCSKECCDVEIDYIKEHGVSKEDFLYELEHGCLPERE